MHASSFFIRAMPFVSLLVSAACVAQPAQQVGPAERHAVIDAIALEMNQHYIFPETAAKLEVALRQQQRAGTFDGAADGDAFAEQLTESLQAVTHDKHVLVRYSALALPPDPVGDDTPPPQQLAEQENEGRFENFGVERAERLAGNIGYLDLRSFDPVGMAAPTLVAAMTLLAHTDALIIDLRQNGGGDPETVALLCSYLFDHRTHLNSLYWRQGNRTEQYWTQEVVQGQRFGQGKPVYVLTSSGTFSAAEEFSYDLLTRKRATLVGETTGGGANPGDVRRLSEHFMMFVPSGRAINPVTGANWEGTGVEPQVKVPADKALGTAQSLALKALIQGEKDDKRRKAMQDRLAEVERSLH